MVVAKLHSQKLNALEAEATAALKDGAWKEGMSESEEARHLPNQTARLTAILGLDFAKKMGYSTGGSQHKLQSVYIAVMTTPEARDRREVVRSSWMRLRAGAPGLGELPWTVRFFLCSEAPDGQKLHHEDHLLDQEVTKNKDIVVVPCTEGYREGLLTKKVRAAMQYFVDHTDAAAYDTFMKADDDAFLYIPGILERLPPLDKDEHVYFGNFYEAGVTPDRRPESSWYEPESLWSGQYPRSAQGMGYGMDRGLLERILRSPDVDQYMLYNEDRAVGVWVDMQKQRGTDITFVRVKGLDGYSKETSPEGHNPSTKVTDTQMYHHLDSEEMGCLAKEIHGSLQNFMDCARARGHKARTYQDLRDPNVLPQHATDPGGDGSDDEILKLAFQQPASHEPSRPLEMDLDFGIREHASNQPPRPLELEMDLGASWIEESKDASSMSLDLEYLNTSKSCVAPKCVGERTSQIVLTGFHRTVGAGIGDRAWLLMQAKNVADHLCAELVVVGRPCDAMGGHGDISCDTEWSDYLGMAAGKEPVFFTAVPLDDSAASSPLTTNARLLSNPYQEGAIGPRPKTAPCQSGFQCFGPQSARVRVVEQAENVVQAMHEGSPFMWYLDGPQFHSTSMPAINRAMEAIKKRGGLSWPPCGLVEVTASKPVTEACQKVMQSLHLDGTDYKTMHIRRGDAQGECDTSIDAVRAYAEKHVTPGAKVVFFTDETRADYLADLKGVLEKIGVEAVHGDEAIRAAGGAARYNDNYFLMQVQGAVNGRCTGPIDPPTFRMDRQSCEV